MYYFSTRNSEFKVTAAEAIVRGLAPDGGLFVPSVIPVMEQAEMKTMCYMNYRERAALIISKYMKEFSTEEIEGLVEKAYGENFDCREIAPLKLIDDKTAILELWHGPTCAFKDMALQILPHLLTASLKKCGEKREVCILVATSGDTGKAALEGFADVEGTKIHVFYPHKGVSDVQELQMTTQSGKNVGVTAVYGNFDDAQTGVKKIFSDKDFAEELSKRGYFLSSANSINWGRLLPQIVYYFSAYCDFVNSGKVFFGETVNFAVPTGNFGDILACWYAKKMGLPVGKLICASNANNVLTDFFKTGVYDRNRAFHNTISPSMDILVSSNLERLLYSVTENDKQVAAYMKSLSEKGSYEVDDLVKFSLATNFDSGYCSDEDTKATIAKMYSEQNYLMDTHTAVAYKVMTDIRANSMMNTPTVVVSTASPFKFCDSVLSALGEDLNAKGTELISRLTERTGIDAPKPLADLDKRERRFNISVHKEEMKAAVSDFLK